MPVLPAEWYKDLFGPLRMIPLCPACEVPCDPEGYASH